MKNQLGPINSSSLIIFIPCDSHFLNSFDGFEPTEDTFILHILLEQ